MLDDAYLHWLDQCGFSDPARTLLTDIRRSPPTRSRQASTRPGTRKPKRDAVGGSSPQVDQ